MHIRFPVQYHHALARSLEQTFGLRQAVVVQGAERAEPAEPTNITAFVGTYAAPHRNDLAQAAADVLIARVQPQQRIGVTWGETIVNVIDRITPGHGLEATVVQLIGSTSRALLQPAFADADEVARSLAERLGGRAVRMPVPYMIDDATIYEALRGQPAVAEVLDLAAQLDLALIGVGTVGASSSMSSCGLLTQAEVDQAAALGAVGDMCGRFIDSNGQPVATPTDDRILGIDLAALRNCPQVICVGAGHHKVTAVLGVLRSGIVNTLVTDAATAAGVLAAAVQPEEATHVQA